MLLWLFCSVKRGILETPAGNAKCTFANPAGLPGLDQAGVYLPQPQTAQRVDVLIPAAVLHMTQAVLNAPVVEE
jgi:hypothetical protein